MVHRRAEVCPTVYSLRLTVEHPIVLDFSSLVLIIDDAHHRCFLTGKRRDDAQRDITHAAGHARALCSVTSACSDHWVAACMSVGTMCIRV